MRPRVVLCMKWGAKYGADYVNRLYAMVRRHLPGAFTFVCLTDDASGIHPEVQCHPIPSLTLSQSPGDRDGGWRKLTTFSEDLYGLRGDALFLDLDVVVVGDLSEFFTLPGPFFIIHDYVRAWQFGKTTGNSSVYRFSLGAHADLLTHFRQHRERVMLEHRNEQAFVTHFLREQKQLQYWPKAWCPSFKYACLPAWPSNYWREPQIPPGAKIVIFHGEINPPDAIQGGRTRRGTRILPASWVARNWSE